VPGCPAHPDNLSETILYLLYQVVGQAPMIPLDEHLRPQWLFGITVHDGAIGPGITNRVSSPKPTIHRNAWSSWDAVVKW
jgi:hypothetical protein